ncbi:glycosyltransferase family 9 protein [Niabella aquatica]
MNIVIFRALKLGDLLCTVPAFRALRSAFPQAHITLLGLPWAKSFVERFGHYIDEFIHFPGYPGLPEQHINPVDIPVFFDLLKKSKIDLLLQMQGDGSIVNELLEPIHPRLFAGFCLPGDERAKKRSFLIYPLHLHEIHRHLALLQQLSIPSAGDELEFPLTTADLNLFNKMENIASLKNYLCIHPGSADINRQWPPFCFARIADHFAALGYTIVLTGSAAEKELTLQVSQLMKYNGVNLAGKTTLGSLGVLLSKSKGLITNCTGVSHLAAALRTRSIVLSMDGEPHRWAPLNHHLHKTINWLTNNNYEAIEAAAEQLFVDNDNM